jgi:hypothetical protein
MDWYCLQPVKTKEEFNPANRHPLPKSIRLKMGLFALAIYGEAETIQNNKQVYRAKTSRYHSNNGFMNKDAIPCQHRPTISEKP